MLLSLNKSLSFFAIALQLVEVNEPLPVGFASDSSSVNLEGYGGECECVGCFRVEFWRGFCKIKLQKKSLSGEDVLLLPTLPYTCGRSSCEGNAAGKLKCRIDFDLFCCFVIPLPVAP